MSALRWLRNAFVTLFAVGLASIIYLGSHYITQRPTHPDRIHVVPFAAHGDYVFLTNGESRGYYLLWALTILVGLIGGLAGVAYDVRLGKIGRPEPAVAAVVTSGFVLGIGLFLYLAFAT